MAVTQQPDNASSDHQDLKKLLTKGGLRRHVVTVDL